MIKANPEQSGDAKVKGLLCKREVEETAFTAEYGCFNKTFRQ